MPVETNHRKNSIKPPKIQQFGGSILILLTLLLMLNLILPSFFGKGVLQVPYSRFIADVEAGKVVRAIVGTSQIQYSIKGTTADGKPVERVFVTTPVAIDLDLPKILREHHVEFAAPPPNENAWFGTLLSWVIPPLIFFGIWAFLMNRQGGKMRLSP